jgi:hypothetical protein
LQMRFRILVYPLAVALAVIGFAPGMAGEASAHEERTVGEYEVEVGFSEEPALVNQLNGVFLSVMKEEVPVEGLDESLAVELIVGGGAAKKEISFVPIEGEPGSYVAAFLPTVTGDYTFRIFGEIEGTEVNESFESGPGRFDSVESRDEAAFPEAPADNAALSATVQALNSKIAGLESGGSDGTARTVGAAGLVAGLIALGLGGYAVMKQRA